MANRKRAITLSLLAMVAVMTVMAEMVIWPQSVREGRGEERVRSKASRHSQGRKTGARSGLRAGSSSI
jgi:hypothetical protein